MEISGGTEYNAANGIEIVNDSIELIYGKTKSLNNQIVLATAACTPSAKSSS